MHSLHELARIARELVFDTVNIIEILTIPFDTLNTVTQKKSTSIATSQIFSGQF